MNSVQGQMIIRKATEADARQIAEIIVEDWQIAYRGIIDSNYLDSMSVEERYQREVKRCGQYTVAAVEDEVLGLAWNEFAGDDTADCEVVALYVRYSKRRSGVGKALFQHSMDTFRASGKRKMIVWCLQANSEARKFYEKMGGKEYRKGVHRWGSRDYEMVSYLYQL